MFSLGPHKVNLLYEVMQNLTDFFPFLWRYLAITKPDKPHICKEFSFL